MYDSDLEPQTKKYRRRGGLNHNRLKNGFVLSNWGQLDHQSSSDDSNNGDGDDESDGYNVPDGSRSSTSTAVPAVKIRTSKRRAFLVANKRVELAAKSRVHILVEE